MEQILFHMAYKYKEENPLAGTARLELANIRVKAGCVRPTSPSAIIMRRTKNVVIEKPFGEFF